MKKLRFKVYNINYKNRYFKLYIPEHKISCMSVTSDDFPIDWLDGDRQAHKYIFEAVKIMLHSNNSIVYFPFKQNSYVHELVKIQRELVFMNSQNTITLSDFKEVKQQALKSKNYYLSDFNYDEEKLLDYAKYIEKKKRYNPGYNGVKMYTEYNDTMFCRYPKVIYAQMYAGYYEFLKRNLEQEYLLTYEDYCIYTTGRATGDFKTKQNHWLSAGFGLGFYDKKIHERIKEAKGNENTNKFW